MLCFFRNYFLIINLAFASMAKQPTARMTIINHLPTKRFKKIKT